MSRIAIAGFQHETNSFALTLADMAAFEMADSWPGLLCGQDTIDGTKGMNLPIAGFAAAAEALGHDLSPILWCAAEPSAPVTTQAFETISSRILDGIESADAVYLDLHGAMISESHDDGEGELLARIRRRFGPDLPVVISLDMHANLSAEMVSLADHICIFRTYPHLDMAETGARCVAPLTRLLAGERPQKRFGQADYLIPTHAQFTGAEPMAGLYAKAEEMGVEMAVGFTGGDTAHTGLAWIAYGPDADAHARHMGDAIAAAEEELGEPLSGARAAVARAMAYPPGRPVILADVEDNAGGGGSSDTMGLLRAMIAEGAQNAILGLIHDPDAAAAAHAAGIGGTIDVALGGRSRCAGDAPYKGRFTVLALSTGEVRYEGQMYGGAIGQIGPCAALRVLDEQAEVTVIVSTTRNQCLDRAYFRHLGLDPEAAHLVGVKSTVHFRADFEPISQAVIPLAVPGALSSDLTTVPYKKLRPGLRLGPCGPEFSVDSKESVD